MSFGRISRKEASYFAYERLPLCAIFTRVTAYARPAGKRCARIIAYIRRFLLFRFLSLCDGFDIAMIALPIRARPALCLPY